MSATPCRAGAKGAGQGVGQAIVGPQGRLDPRREAAPKDHRPEGDSLNAQGRDSVLLCSVLRTRRSHTRYAGRMGLYKRGQQKAGRRAKK